VRYRQQEFALAPFARGERMVERAQGESDFGCLGRPRDRHVDAPLAGREPPGGAGGRRERATEPSREQHGGDRGRREGDGEGDEHAEGHLSEGRVEVAHRQRGDHIEARARAPGLDEGGARGAAHRAGVGARRCQSLTHDIGRVGASGAAGGTCAGGVDDGEQGAAGGGLGL